MALDGDAIAATYAADVDLQLHNQTFGASMRGSRWNPRNPFGNCYDPKASQWLPIDGYDPEKTPGLYRLPKRDQASVKQYTVQPAPVVQSAPIVRSPAYVLPHLRTKETTGASIIGRPLSAEENSFTPVQQLLPQANLFTSIQGLAANVEAFASIQSVSSKSELSVNAPLSYTPVKRLLPNANSFAPFKPLSPEARPFISTKDLTATADDFLPVKSTLPDSEVSVKVALAPEDKSSISTMPASYTLTDAFPTSGTAQARANNSFSMNSVTASAKSIGNEGKEGSTLRTTPPVSLDFEANRLASENSVNKSDNLIIGASKSLSTKPVETTTKPISCFDNVAVAKAHIPVQSAQALVADLPHPRPTAAPITTEVTTAFTRVTEPVTAMAKPKFAIRPASSRYTLTSRPITSSTYVLPHLRNIVKTTDLKVQAAAAVPAIGTIGNVTSYSNVITQSILPAVEPAVIDLSTYTFPLSCAVASAKVMKGSNEGAPANPATGTDSAVSPADITFDALDVHTTLKSANPMGQKVTVASANSVQSTKLTASTTISVTALLNSTTAAFVKMLQSGETSTSDRNKYGNPAALRKKVVVKEVSVPRVSSLSTAGIMIGPGQGAVSNDCQAQKIAKVSNGKGPAAGNAIKKLGNVFTTSLDLNTVHQIMAARPANNGWEIVTIGETSEPKRKAVIFQEPTRAIAEIVTPKLRSTKMGPWKRHPGLEKVLRDPKAYEEYLGCLLGETAIEAPVTYTYDVKPFGPCVTFDDDKISESSFPTDLRAIIGNDSSKHLRDWTGGWTPAPTDWELRVPFDDTFKDKFIKDDWQVSGIPWGPTCTVDHTDERFISGSHPISNDDFDVVIGHPESPPHPETLTSKKRYQQTAASETARFVKKANEMAAHREASRLLREKCNMEFQRETEAYPIVNAWTPKIDMYTRPVESKDAAAIASIYNWYVVNSTVTEDQTPVTTEIMLGFIETSARLGHPIIVAIQGKLPNAEKIEGRSGRSPRTVLPKNEKVIGWSSAEPVQYGFNSLTTGAHRYTAELKVFVDIEYTHKNVGRNLMDQLLNILRPSHTFRNECTFVNPKDNKIYKEGRHSAYHTLTIRLPAQKKHDQVYDLVSGWLRNLWMMLEVARLPSWVRTTQIHKTPTRFFDLVIFQMDATPAGEMDPWA